jgi:hypothetical protein
VLRYIKHLVQITTGASSFYVNVGLNRLLRNYSTPEVQNVYEFATEHYPASEEYRKVKGRLMNLLTARFDRFLAIRISEYGERRFEAYEDQRPLAKLVEDCLEVFTPWSSRQACWQGSMESFGGDPGTGLRQPGFSNHLDRIEINRCHWFIHSRCYGELTKKLGLDPPGDRLLVPQFFLKGDHGQTPDPTAAIERKVAPLTDGEIREMKDRINSSEVKRQQIPLQPLKIVAHDAVFARLDPRQEEKRRFDIPHGTKLLEVRSEATGTDLILATHWIDYTEWNGIAAGEYTIALKQRRELVFKIVPAGPGTEQEGGAAVEVESRSRSPLADWADRIAAFVRAPQNLTGYAFAAVLFVAVGWLAATVNYRSRLIHEQRTVEHPVAAVPSPKTPTVPQEQSPPESAKIVATYFFASGSSSVRGTENPEEPVVTFARGNPLVMLDFAVVPGAHRSYRVALSSFAGEEELLRENDLRPTKKHNDWMVEFALPSALVADRTHYLATLSAVDSGGRTTPLSRFLFEVRK